MQLTPTETTEYDKLRSFIHKHKQAFVDVGLALMRIRDGELFRAQYKDFDEFCHREYGCGQSYANHHIRQAAAVKALPADVATIVANEGQAREVAKAAPEHREKVVKTAAARAESAGRKPTAKDFAEARLEVEDPPRVQAATPEQMQDSDLSSSIEADLADNKKRQAQEEKWEQDFTAWMHRECKTIPPADCKHFRNVLRRVLRKSEGMDNQ